MQFLFLFVCTTLGQNTLRPLRHSCTVHDVAVCRYHEDGANTHQGYQLGQTLPTDTDCEFCVADAFDTTTNTSQPVCTARPVTNLYCVPDTYQCAACGSFAVGDLVGSSYTITFRKYCNPACSLDPGEANFVEMTSSVQFSRLDNLAIVGPTPTPILRGPCPMLEFSYISALRIDNLIIQCTSALRTDIFPAILIKDTTQLVLNVESLMAQWYVQSAIVVLGGQTTTYPIVRSVNMEGSRIQTIRVQQSAFVAPATAVLGLLYGVVDATMMYAFSKVVVLPVLPPDTSTTKAVGSRAKLLTNESTSPLNIKNWTRFTDTMGPDYELDFYKPGTDTDASDKAYALTELNAWILVYIILMCYMNTVIHQDKIYYYFQSIKI